jgi:hypothetical protein
MKDGESPSEAEIAATLAGMIAEAPHRVALTTFASNVGRVIGICRAAKKAGREVVMSGRSLHRIMGIAQELGMLEGLPTLHDQDAYKTLPRNKTVLICTGSQGEPRAAIARIARGDHPVIDLNAGDRVIFSSWAIPGNEREVIDIQNMLIDKGVDVITQKDGLVHVTGHPRRDELRKLYSWVKPQVLVPSTASPCTCRPTPNSAAKRASPMSSTPAMAIWSASFPNPWPSPPRCAPANSTSMASCSARPRKAASKVVAASPSAATSSSRSASIAMVRWFRAPTWLSRACPKPKMNRFPISSRKLSRTR